MDNAKDKAIEIYDSYWNFSDIDKSLAIQCAIIHVKGIIEECREFNSDRESFWYDVLHELNQM